METTVLKNRITNIACKKDFGPKENAYCCDSKQLIQIIIKQYSFSKF